MPDNQTNEDWLELTAVSDDPSALGTGVFLTRGAGGKDFFTDITYNEMLARDQRSNFFAFSWVPHVVASYVQVRQQTCGGRCAKTCKRPGCLCDRSIGVCS
jgi:hypothetical protein